MPGFTDSQEATFLLSDTAGAEKLRRAIGDARDHGVGYVEHKGRHFEVLSATESLDNTGRVRLRRANSTTRSR